MAGRTTAILERFPCHVGATDPGKRVRAVVDGLAEPIDVQSRQLGDIRRAHRLGEAPTAQDLLALAALHRIGDEALQVTDERFERLAALAAANPIDRAAIEVALGLPASGLAGADPDELGDALARLLRFSGRLAVHRQVVRRVVTSFRAGNTTAAAILAAAAAYLGLEISEVTHIEDRWWHLAACRDLLGLELAGTAPAGDVLALEENPFGPASIAPVERRHGDRFGILRGGLEAVAVSVRVAGREQRTVGPMVVNVDEGSGVAFTGAVADGSELVFAPSGRVTLDGFDVTGSAFGFSGGVFASSDEVPPAKDYVFADTTDPGAFVDRTATFAVTVPVADALGTLGGFPHAGATVPPMTLALGESRWAFFVRIAHLGSLGPGAGRTAVPVTLAGIFDRSTFADAGPVEGLAPAARVGFSWEEREPFAVRVILPRRFAALDDDRGTLVREPLRVLLDRHRAAGVRLGVDWAEQRWDLGRGVARDAGSDAAIGTVVSGTALWPDGTEQPAPA